MANSNYPDDIRKYDNDPRSPFFDDSKDDALIEATTEIEELILSGEKRGDYDIGDVAEDLLFQNDRVSLLLELMNASDADLLKVALKLKCELRESLHEISIHIAESEA